MLNIKQEKFIQNIINGMSQRQAYKDAYKVKYRDDVIDRRASELFNKSEVQVRYQELLKKIEDDSIMSAKERMIWLSDVINGKIKEIVAVQRINNETGESEMVETEFPSQLKTKLVALDTLNKMSGEYTTNIKGNLTISYEEALKQVSSEDEY